MTSLFVREIGPDTAPTIVFLHGGGVSGWMWDEIAAGLPDFHCLIPDLPGHGGSMTLGVFDLNRAVEAIAALTAEQAHGGGAHFVGLSLGAQTLVALLAAHPQLALSAVISGTLVHPLPGANLIGATMALYTPFKNMPAMIRANMWGYGVPAKHYENFAADTRLLTTEAFTALLRANMTFQLPERLDRVTAPVLVIAAEREQRVMKRSARDLAAALPNARAMMPAAVGHNWPLEAPGRFTQVVRAWVTDSPLPDFLRPLN